MVEVPLEKRIALTGGLDFWHTHPVEELGLPSVLLTDGPHGVRRQADGVDEMDLSRSQPATCFPPAVALASSWSRDTLRLVGTALGLEARALGVGILLGPGVNLKRSPLCGRNFEYFSEDPVVAGELAAAYVEGLQAQGVGASVKHFAANNQETDRMRRSSDVDERTLRELYLRAFGTVVRRAQPWTVMASYNPVNGVLASQNPFLLTQVLRDEWGFEGFVVSDWGAVRNRAAALRAGLDLQMPVDGGDGQRVVAAAMEAGELDEATLDRACERIERVLRRAAAAQREPAPDLDVDGHHALARRVAERCIVLLKNDPVPGAGPMLPLAAGASIAVVGEFAHTPRYQGAGSSRVNPTRLDNALDRIVELADGEVSFAPGFTTERAERTPPELLVEAARVAVAADVVLVFLGLGEHDESEGYDRTTMSLPDDQLAVLSAVLDVNPHVVVVLSNGAAVTVSSFVDRVPALVEGWLQGQAGGPAIADVLFGVVNPSGKLTETIPERLEDVPSYLHFPGDPTGVHYGEGLFLGYRGHDARKDWVTFPFGHGLSYTSFEYADLRVTSSGDGFAVDVRVSNTGERAGREVVQVYVAVPDSAVVRAPRELKGFEEVWLEPGASASVSVRLGADDLAFWSVADCAWVVEGGRYVVSVGASSRDLRLEATVELAGNQPRRVFTPESSLGELLADPVAAPLLMELADGAFDANRSDDLGTDLLTIMADAPVAAVFAGKGDGVQRLLDAANRPRD